MATLLSTVRVHPEPDRTNPPGMVILRGIGMIHAESLKGLAAAGYLFATQTRSLLQWPSVVCTFIQCPGIQCPFRL